MFFLVWYLFLLIIYLSFYTNSFLQQILLVTLFYLILQTVYYYAYEYLSHHATPFSMEQLYHFVKHGDVINTNSIPTKQPFYGMYRYFNYSIAHCLLIIEENGEKYVLHTHPNTYPVNTSHILNTFTEDIISSEWHLVKEPLLEFLHTSEHSLYHIYRPPPNKKPIRIKQLSFCPKTLFNKPFYYCTLMISDLLVQHGHIPPSSRYYTYRTDEFVQSLKHNGYQLYTVSY